MRLLWLPHLLERWGLDVELVPGWERRGQPFRAAPSIVVGHHTATSARARGDLPTLAVLRDGRSDLPGPLCQIGLGRSGRVYVVASGKANHAGRGAWKGLTDSARTIGVEVEHPGTGPWTAAQLRAFDLTAAALLDGLGSPASHYAGHREWALPAGRKVDPGGVNLTAQRARVRELLSRGPAARPTEYDVPLSPADLKAVAAAVKPVVEERVRAHVLTLLGGDASKPDTDPNPSHTSLADVLREVKALRGEVAELRAR